MRASTAALSASARKIRSDTAIDKTAWCGEIETEIVGRVDLLAREFEIECLPD